MGASTGNNERAKGQEHPMKRDVAASFVNQISKGYGDGEIGQADAGISNHMSPHQSGFAQVAIEMRQEIRSQNATRKSRPDQEWSRRNRQQCSHSIKQLTCGELRRFK